MRSTYEVMREIDRQPMVRLSEKRLELEAIYLLHSDTIYIQ